MENHFFSILYMALSDLMKIAPSEIAAEDINFPSSLFSERISNFLPSLITVVTPSSL